MGKTEAKAKLQKELAAYRKATGELSGYNCYQRAPEIMFTEAAADRINWLLDDADMCALIEAGGTLKGCVASIITYCKQDIGQAAAKADALRSMTGMAIWSGSLIMPRATTSCTMTSSPCPMATSSP